MDKCADCDETIGLGEQHECKPPWMNSDPKIKNYRNPRYRKFIRSKLCLICSSKSQVTWHHEAFTLKGTGIKGPDIWTVPLCPNCHSVRNRLGFDSFWEASNLNPMYEIMKLNNEFFSLNKGKKI